MYCSNCGGKNPESKNFCSHCGSPLNNNLENNSNDSSFTPVKKKDLNGNHDFSSVLQPNIVIEKKSSTGKALKIVGIIFIVLVAVGVYIFLFVSSTSDKLVCKSNEGNITIMYNNKTLTGYTARGISYDLDGQQKIAETIGVDAYIDQFEIWFSQNTTGSCTRK